MMDEARALFRSGDLAACLAAVQQEVRGAPAASPPRVFLVQLLMIQGQWDRALNQLKVLKELDPATIPMVNTYSIAIGAERVRADVFAGRRTPLLIADPDPWIVMLVQALALQAEGHPDEAAALREQAFEQAPATAGSLDGRAFKWLADADSRLGPIFEVILNGAYYWLPMDCVGRMELEKPEDARDLVWLPVRITFKNEGQAIALMPTRYPGSEHGDPAIQLSRRTEWSGIGGDGFAGLGQRVLASDIDEVGLLDVREIILAAATDE
jgi:type VI secretion system protein ImpE